MAEQKLGMLKQQTKNFTDMLQCEGFGPTINREHWSEELRRYAKDEYGHRNPRPHAFVERFGFQIHRGTIRTLLALLFQGRIVNITPSNHPCSLDTK